MANWGVALGAGAEAAYNTYRGLEDEKRRKAADERAERALKIQEAQEARAASRYQREQQLERDRRALFSSILGGTEGALKLPSGVGEAGSRTSAAMSRESAPPVQGALNIGGVTAPTTAPVGGVDAPAADLEAPRAAIQPTETPAPAVAAPRVGRPDLARLQIGLAALGDYRGAEAIGRMRETEAELALKEIQRAREFTNLSKDKLDLAYQQYGVHVARAGQMVEQLGNNPHAPLTPEMIPQVRAVTDQLLAAYDMLPDGRSARVNFNDDGSFNLQFVNKKGEVVGEQKFTTVGQLQMATRLAGMLTGPTAYNQWITVGRHADIKNELEAEIKAAEAAGKRVEAEKKMAEWHAITQFDELLKNAPENETALRALADTLEILAPDKFRVQIEETDELGNTVKSYVNVLHRQLDRILPKQQITVTDDKGKRTTYTTQDAVQDYVESLPKALAETGGNVDVVLAQLQREHDSQFGAGAFKKYVLPLLRPHLAGARQQYIQAAQGGARAGGQPQQAIDPRFLQRAQALQEQGRRERAARPQGPSPEYEAALEQARQRILSRTMPWEVR